MKSFSLCQELYPELISVVPTNCLGDGADGEVFDIEGTPNRVVKFSILYHYSAPLEQEFNHIQKVLEFLIKKPLSAYARVFEFKKLGKSFRNTVNGRQEYFLYYYIMEKCIKISDDEKKVFHSILSHEDQSTKKNYSDKQIKNMLYGLNMGLDFDLEKVFMFWDNIRKAPILHSDIHPRNIMKNQFGDFKLIDFDRSKLNK